MRPVCRRFALLLKVCLANVEVHDLAVTPALPCLVAALFAAIVAPAPCLGDLVPARLRCEYLANPLAIDGPQPRLSWVLESAERAQRQRAYRIIVAADPQALLEDRGDLWDSGEVTSRAQMQIPYQGKTLTPGQRAFWKVRVWDETGRSSDSTETAFWQAGLRTTQDWLGRWIAHPDNPPPALPARNGFHSALTNTSDATQWVVVDLGAKRRFDGIRLCPARPFDWQPDTPGFLFPARFRLEASDDADFTGMRVLADLNRQDVNSPGTNVATFRLAPAMEARFVRLLVTRLRLRDADQHAFALAELQVLEGGRVLSENASVSSSGSIENAAWSKAFLVDGDMASHAGTRPPAEPATVLRKEFTAPAPVRRAMLWATALGAYQLRLNGRSVGDAVLPPEWTDYHQRVQYQAYDVTALVRPGTNVLVATLGDAWYAGRLGMSDGLIGVLRRVYGTKPWFLTRLEVELENGPRLRIRTDGSWVATRDGPIRSSDLLDGEVFDARRELAGVDQPGFDTGNWAAVESQPLDAFPGHLVAQPNEPIRVIEPVAPIGLTESQPGVFVFDLGQNIAGRCRIQLRGRAGTEVTLRHAEMINEDGTIYVANLRGAPQVDRYILRGDANGETFEPAFTQHGFRYVEVTGLGAPPSKNDLLGLAFNSAAPEVGGFECSDPMLNRLWRNILWTQRANLMSSPTDCPQRDERLGWMGDIQAFSQTAIFNMDMAAFFTKWVQDVRDAQARNGRFPDFAPHPYVPDVRFSGAPAWADAGVIVPWRCYVNYADRRMLEQHFDAAVRWVEFVRGANPDLLWRQQRGNDYNDWLNGDWVKKEGWPTKGGSVPHEVFATAFFAHSTDLLSRMARVLGREAEAAKYGELFDAIRAAFQRAFVQPDGAIRGDTQAGYALALHFDLLPQALRTNAAQRLAANIEQYDGHLATGIQSTHRALLELSERGYHELAWQLVTNRTFPSWGYMIENGATTIWERWDGFVKGRGFQDAGMNSFNHWALGAVGEWMTRHILGFQPEETHPGWERFTIHPRPGGGVTWARGHYESPRGRIASDWRLTPGEFRLDVIVPANTSAAVHFPTREAARIREGGTTVDRVPGIRHLRTLGDETVMEVASGSYRFQVTLD